MKSEHVGKHPSGLEVSKQLKCMDWFEHMKDEEVDKLIMNLPHVKWEPSSSLDNDATIVVTPLKLHHEKLEQQTSLDSSIQ